MCMVQVSLLLVYLLSYTLNPLLHYFLIFFQFNSILIIIYLVLVLVLGLGLEGQVLVNITAKTISKVSLETIRGLPGGSYRERTKCQKGVRKKPTAY